MSLITRVLGSALMVAATGAESPAGTTTVQPGEGITSVLTRIVVDTPRSGATGKQIRDFTKATDTATPLTVATRLLHKIPQAERPVLKPGDQVSIDSFGIHHQPKNQARDISTLPPEKGEPTPKLLLAFPDTEKKPKPTTPLVPPATAPQSLAAPVPPKTTTGTAPSKFDFSPQKLRDPQNQTASYEAFKADLEAAQDPGLIREKVSNELFGDARLNRMFTYSDGFAKTDVKGAEAVLRKSDDIRWQQIAAFCSVFGPDTKLTGASKPFEGYKAKDCLPNGKPNHPDAIDLFFYKEKAPNPNISAIQGGVIVAAGSDWKNNKGGLSGKSGNGVIIATPIFNKDEKYQGIALTHYYHLRDLKTPEGVTRKVGDIVKPGDFLGHGGTTGINAVDSSPHLHFALHFINLPTAHAGEEDHVTVNGKDLYSLFDNKTTVSELAKKYKGHSTQAARYLDAARTATSEGLFFGEETVVR